MQGPALHSAPHPTLLLCQSPLEVLGRKQGAGRPLGQPLRLVPLLQGTCLRSRVPSQTEGAPETGKDNSGLGAHWGTHPFSCILDSPLCPLRTFTLRFSSSPDPSANSSAEFDGRVKDGCEARYGAEAQVGICRSGWHTLKLGKWPPVLGGMPGFQSRSVRKELLSFPLGVACLSNRGAGGREEGKEEGGLASPPWDLGRGWDVLSWN